MFNVRPPGLGFSVEDEDVLRHTDISYEGGPGTILRDFDALLDYVMEHEVQLTPKGQLRLSALKEINSRLVHPIELGLERPVFKSYPPIQGLYLLIRTTGLTSVKIARRKRVLGVDEAAYESWQGLNPTERYGNLLEAWLLYGRPEILGERSPFSTLAPGSFSDIAWVLAQLPPEGLTGVDEVRAVTGIFIYAAFNLGLMDLFGFIDVQSAAPEPGEGWSIERIAPARFGRALVALLAERFFGHFENILALQEETEVRFGVLQSILRPYFPEWQHNLVLPKWVVREGAHVFRVSLGKVYRLIAMPPQASLYQLASAILNAFDFDHDHLYEFAYEARTGGVEHVYHPYMDEGPSVTEVTVGQVPLQVGQTMTFVYDFGDWWEFAVALERVDPSLHVDRPTLIEEHGEAPEQYNLEW